MATTMNLDAVEAWRNKDDHKEYSPSGEGSGGMAPTVPQQAGVSC